MSILLTIITYFQPIEAKFLALSSEGKKPFIEYNGRHYPDSDLIINFLVKEKKIKYNMTSEQKAISHLVQRLCDKSMYILNLYSKLEENMPMFAKLIKGNASTPEWHLLFMRPMIYYFLWNRVNSDGTGGHTKSEVVELLQQDLDAAERILGEKKFVAGEEASGGDFALFAHLMCAYYMPFTIPLRTIVDNRCPRLKAYMDRNHWNFFADYLLHDNEKVV
uniref:GST C-terminal domain-containing protein n=1 Tax=Bursaphelenchus xylophilus TaxID=6326 RepID=A0A1I7RU28_BURXY